MDIKAELKKRGFTEVQCNSKTANAVEELLAEDSGIINDTLIKIVKELSEQSEIALNNLRYSQKKAEDIEDKVTEIEKRFKTYKTETRRVIITDDRLLNALNLYSGILDRTKTILGDGALTEPVILKLLETASECTCKCLLYCDEKDRPAISVNGKENPNGNKP